MLTNNKGMEGLALSPYSAARKGTIAYDLILIFICDL